MITMKVGKDTSLRDGGVHFRTFQKLTKQREVLDHKILKLQENLFKSLEVQALGKKKRYSKKKKYVARMKNTIILKDAIQQSMVPDCKMTMKDILKAIHKEHLYHTRSDSLYTMVNNKLHIMVEDKKRGTLKMLKISRGVFMLQRTG